MGLFQVGLQTTPAVRFTWPCELVKKVAEESLSFLLCVLEPPFFRKQQVV